MKQHKRSGVVAVAVLWAVMAWAVGTKGKADMPTLDWLGREEAVKWQGGGGFRFYELGEELLDAQGSSPNRFPIRCWPRTFGGRRRGGRGTGPAPRAPSWACITK